MPVSNRLPGLRVRAMHRLKLGKWNGKGPAFPCHRREHLMLAFFFFGHAGYLDNIALAERRDRTFLHAFRLERALDGVVEVVIPSQSLLLGTVAVNNDFVFNPLFAFLVFVHNNGVNSSSPLTRLCKICYLDSTRRTSGVSARIAPDFLFALLLLLKNKLFLELAEIHVLCPIEMLLPFNLACLGSDHFHGLRANDKAHGVKHVEKILLLGVADNRANVYETLPHIALALEVFYELRVGNPPSQRALGIEHVRAVNKDVHFPLDK